MQPAGSHPTTTLPIALTAAVARGSVAREHGERLCELAACVVVPVQGLRQGTYTACVAVMGEEGIAHAMGSHGSSRGVLTSIVIVARGGSAACGGGAGAPIWPCTMQLVQCVA